MSERRVQPRFNVSLDVRWQGSASHYNLRMADISEGGGYVDTILEVTKGEILFLKILMPDGHWFEVQGVVTHHFPRLGFGLRFVNLDEDQRRQIRWLTQYGASSNPEARHEPPMLLEEIHVTCHEVM